MMFSVESINQLSNRSLTDRTQDSDSCNVGSIPAGCIFPRFDTGGFFISVEKTPTSASGEQKQVFLSGSTISD